VVPQQIAQYYGPGPYDIQQILARDAQCMAHHGGILSPCDPALLVAFDDWLEEDDPAPWNHDLCCWHDPDAPPMAAPAA
jgi:hypothetical protein